MKTIRHFDILIRRGYFFLKIFSFYLTFDIYETEKKEEKLGIYYLREIKGLVKIYCRQINFKFGLKNTVKARCPICGMFFTTFKELEHGIHMDCALVLNLTRGGK